MKFTFADLVCAGTGYLYSESKDDNGMSSVYNVYNFMTGDNLFSHQLPRASSVCMPAIQEQHIWVKRLREVIKDQRRICQPECWESMFNTICAAFKTELGKEIACDMFELIPLSEWIHREPITELAEKIGGEKIIALINEGERSTP